MKRVLKWSVPADDQDHPIGSGRVVLVACQQTSARVEVWTEEALVNGTRHARVYGTGQPIPEGDVHLGSVITEGGALVWHVYGSH